MSAHLCRGILCVDKHHTHTGTHTGTHACTHRHTCAHTHTRAHRHTRTGTHACTHMRAHVPLFLPPCSFTSCGCSVSLQLLVTPGSPEQALGPPVRRRMVTLMCPQLRVSTGRVTWDTWAGRSLGPFLISCCHDRQVILWGRPCPSTKPGSLALWTELRGAPVGLLYRHHICLM